MEVEIEPSGTTFEHLIKGHCKWHSKIFKTTGADMLCIAESKGAFLKNEANFLFGCSIYILLENSTFKSIGQMEGRLFHSCLFLYSIMWYNQQMEIIMKYSVPYGSFKDFFG
ncbi:uncharacterized protein [Typha latifolia]|uniref:uncharacterized protein n=1 Tax=Typha latifolia TaxID=4733 RepID=UPI003C2E434F